VTLTPATVTLNVPAADGFSNAELPYDQTFTARVNLSPEGQNGQVTWSAPDSVVIVPVSAGVVRVSLKADAASGDVTLTATSMQEPSKKATASITVTRNSQLQFEIQ